MCGVNKDKEFSFPYITFCHFAVVTLCVVFQDLNFNVFFNLFPKRIQTIKKSIRFAFAMVFLIALRGRKFISFYINKSQA